MIVNRAVILQSPQPLFGNRTEPLCLPQGDRAEMLVTVAVRSTSRHLCIRIAKLYIFVCVVGLNGDKNDHLSCVVRTIDVSMD